MGTPNDPWTLSLATGMSALVGRPCWIRFRAQSRALNPMTALRDE
jgi:hypothetical protein